MHFMDKDLEKLIHDAIKEDCYDKDITSTSLIDNKKEGIGNFIVKTPGVLSGVTILKEVFRQINPKIKVNLLKEDGEYLNKGDVIASISGKMNDILKGERTALNFIQVLSGVATTTDKYAQELKGTNCQIVDSYKTIPLFKKLTGLAVSDGFGINYSKTLSDQIIIKDYHIIMAGSIIDAVQNVRLKNGYDLPIDVEITSEEEYLEALETDCEIITLCNLSDELIEKLCLIPHQDKLIKVSGNISIGKIRTLALMGVDYIAIDNLVHGSKALDICFKFLKKSFK